MHTLERSASLLEAPSIRVADAAERRRAMAALGAEQVFDFEKWAEHRSCWKYAHQVASLPWSHTVRSIVLPLLWITAVTVFVGANFWLSERHMLPFWASLPRVSVAVLEPLTITSFALSLLLVFRTNASYARFAEARQIWGLMLNRSRDLVRQCIAFFPASAWDEKSTFARWTMVMSKTLLCHLRTSSSLKDEVSQVLSKQEMQILLACDHPVVMTIQVLSELVEGADITPIQRWQMHENLTTMHDVLGGCERILRTPIPVAYTRHTSRFVIIWMSLLPYALWEKFGWATLIIALLIGVLLLGINEIGIDVEEPFSLLPLESITDRAFQDCRQCINMQVMVMDRLIETKPRAINNYVFDIVTHESDTKLVRETEFTPLTRMSRSHMAEGIAQPNFSSMDISTGDPSHAHPVSMSTTQAAASQGLATSARIRSMYCQECPTACASAAELISSFRERPQSQGKLTSDDVNMMLCPPRDL